MKCLEQKIDLNKIIEKAVEINKISINGKEFVHTPERITGHWVKTYNGALAVWRCSNCGAEPIVATQDNSPKFKFCPYCGVEMGCQNEVTYNVTVAISYKDTYPKNYKKDDISTLEYIRSHFEDSIKNLIHRVGVETKATCYFDNTTICTIYLPGLSINDYKIIKEQFSPPTWLFRSGVCSLTLTGMDIEVKRLEN